MIAIDTNILIYACSPTDPARQERALNLIASTVDGVLLWQVACEFIAASRRLAPQGFTSAHAWDRLSEYLEVFPLVVPAEGTLTRARLLHVEQKVSFWDSMIIAACIECGVRRLYSEDLPGRYCQILWIGHDQAASSRSPSTN
jgi:predicted nucleic acid-binding protein